MYRLLLITFISIIVVGNPMNLKDLDSEATKLMGYSPGYELINKGKAPLKQVMITCHGSGANKQIGQCVAGHIKLPIFTFNFPDHDCFERKNFNALDTTFGTFQEYEPLLYLLGTLIDANIQTISLYGFSAGGGVIINTLAILNTHNYDKELERLIITREKAQKILKAIEAGHIILEAPLKSVEEILSIRPNDQFIQTMAPRFKKNNLEPIDSVKELKGLKLSILIYFEEPDEILSNRDDELYYQKLKAINPHGVTQRIKGFNGGHNAFHPKLWNAYKQFQKS